MESELAIPREDTVSMSPNPLPNFLLNDATTWPVVGDIVSVVSEFETDDTAPPELEELTIPVARIETEDFSGCGTG